MTLVLERKDEVVEADGLKKPASGPGIVVILPRGETIRNFVYSGTVDTLSRNADVTLLTVLPNREYQESCRRRYGRVLELHDVRERWIVRIHRELLDLAHGRWLWSGPAKARWCHRDAEATTLRAKVKRIGKKAACYPFASQPGLAVLSASERRVSKWFRTTDEYLRLFRELKPALVFNASHIHSANAVQAIQAAQWLGIPTATFLFSWDNLTSQGRILLPYDHYLVWNDRIGAQLLEMYPAIRPGQVTVTGTPQFDFHFRREFEWTRAEFCRNTGADPSRPIVLYTTGMSNHTPGEPRIVERIAAMLRTMTDLGPPQLMVRVYPKDQTGRFEPVKASSPDILFPAIPWEAAWLTPMPDDNHLLTNMLRHADVGVNIASTISLELCMMGRPAINVAYNPDSEPAGLIDFADFYDWEHYRPVVESGSVVLARSEGEMESLLRRALTGPMPSVDRGRAFLRSMFGDTLDGRSSDRVANQLLRLAGVAQPS